MSRRPMSPRTIVPDPAPRIDTAGIRRQVMLLLLDVAPEVMMAVDAVLVRELPAT